mmetsp:Transcript_62074/g.72575  ORF Transcript_62074/g.72575 Transcript_62074/m.72575 type:complete len:288 (+) Transcript_62074:210-1073(+)
MTSRATSTLKSHLVRQRLVKLLGGNASNTVNNSHGSTISNPFAGATASVDVSVHHTNEKSFHSYDHLRTAYLKRLHEIHPDKFVHERQNTATMIKTEPRTGVGSLVEDKSLKTGTSNMNNSNNHQHHEMVLELKNAWNEYKEIAEPREKLTRYGKQVKPDTHSFDFTMFGVGCSFDDTQEERDLRTKIMDQASRGWFPSGVLPNTDDGNGDGKLATNALKLPQKQHQQQRSMSSLCDDDMFVEIPSNNIDTKLANGETVRGQFRNSNKTSITPRKIDRNFFQELTKR